jgi:GDP-L-fucose synthase
MNNNSLILICGSSGLVGSATVDYFKSQGYNNLLTPRSAELDLRDQKATSDFFAKKKPEYCILASAKVGGILANSLYPAEFIRDNLLIQTNTIDAAYKNGCKKFCFLGSSCIYPKKAICPIKESEMLNGKLETTNSSYALAKLAGIEMINSYRKQYGFNGYSLMPTNLIGFNDNFTENSHVFPALIKKFYNAIKQNDPFITLYGTGIAKREFLNSKELAKVIFETMKMEKVPELMNVGIGKDIAIKDLALMMKEVLGYKGEIAFDSSKPDGTLRKVLDVSLMNSIGIETKSNLKQDILDIYNWYDKNY